MNLRFTEGNFLTLNQTLQMESLSYSYYRNTVLLKILEVNLLFFYFEYMLY